MLNAAQVIIPLGEFPLTGYKVAEDESVQEIGWHRKFAPFSIATGQLWEYWWVDVQVVVYSSAATARNSFLAETCDYRRPETPPTSTVELTAPSSGELNRACLYDFRSTSSGAGARVFSLHTLWRNVPVTTQANPRDIRITNGATTTMMAEVANKQILIIDRVAPKRTRAGRHDRTFRVVESMAFRVVGCL